MIAGAQGRQEPERSRPHCFAVCQARSCTWRRGAFTLIELLLVITLIALLASLLLPGLSRAKATARSAQCRNNLRQIGIGLNLYVADSSDRYPFYMLFNSRERRVPAGWFELLRPYVRYAWLDTNGLFKCPDYRGQTRGTMWDAASAQPLDASGSYGYNCKRSYG